MKTHLTKSLFKIAEECPAKLYYAMHDEQYNNAQIDDPFMAALADGGFQVGELAKLYFPGGVMIDTLGKEEACRRTSELLARDNAVIFEAAIMHENFFIRVDILVKKGKNLELIEVKSKSYDPGKWRDQPFITPRGKIDSSFKHYLEDVAFQKFVMASAMPEMKVKSLLMLVDKSRICASDGLHQKFRIVKKAGRHSCVASVTELSAEELNNPLLTIIPVDHQVDMIYAEQSEDYPGLPPTFKERARAFARALKNNERLEFPINPECKKCQFFVPAGCLTALHDGKHECFCRKLKWQEEDFKDPTIFEIYNCRTKNFLAAGVVKMKDLPADTFPEGSISENGMDTTMRQRQQVEKCLNHDDTVFCLPDELRSEMKKWKYPLHFIDFETSMPAIPFHKGMAPYEGIAFQFSHHIMHENGRVEHAGEFLDDTPGHFPNFDFLRELKRQLTQDNGTVFRYSHHENTYLNHIFDQLEYDKTMPSAERSELKQFILSITKHEDIEGPRNMVDQCDIVKRYYYNPHTKGSNSLKYVLPAILNRSSFLQATYSKPIKSIFLTSRNFRPDHVWLRKDNGGQIINPYKALQPVTDFLGVSDDELDFIEESEEINNGGAALVAYSKLQYSTMTDEERKAITGALKSYCELDTLAMVMLHQAFMEITK
jgi:hypothetical protein